MSLALFSLLFSLFRFCAMRWVQDRPVAERVIEVWGPCAKLIRHYESLSKSKRPKNKSNERLVSHYTDLLVLVKLQFFVFVGTIFEPYLSIFQTDAPMIPFIFTELENVYNNLLSQDQWRITHVIQHCLECKIFKFSLNGKISRGIISKTYKACR